MFTSELLEEGQVYTRKNLIQKFNITDATVNTGVFRPVGYQSLWLFITEDKTKDRPQSRDVLDRDTLYWDGQSEGRTDRLIIEHAINGLELLVFYRKKRNEHLNYGFRYEGHFRYESHTGSHPTQFVLCRLHSLVSTVERDIEALQIEESYKEGKLLTKLVNKHERNPDLRAAAIKIHGVRCQACDFSFAETYGAYGKDFIEVHHLYPISKYTGEKNVNPTEDMRVVCANCHRIIHRNADKPLSLEELRQIIHSHREANKKQ